MKVVVVVVVVVVVAVAVAVAVAAAAGVRKEHHKLYIVTTSLTIVYFFKANSSLSLKSKGVILVSHTHDLFCCFHCD